MRAQSEILIIIREQNKQQLLAAMEPVLRILALNAGEGSIEALPELSMHPGDSFRNVLCSGRRCENGRWWLFSQKG